ncbi:MAG: hypothetical protein HY426_02590 [Candidatus Levybacteria bacterium]|nr:hypothetical protein [Candidatus Levybacteria bacterium]
MSEHGMGSGNAPAENPTLGLVDYPTPPAMDQIRDRLVSAIELIDREGKIVEIPDRYIAERRALSKAVRDDSQVLIPKEPGQGHIIDMTIANSNMLTAWLQTRGSKHFVDGLFQLHADPSPRSAAYDIRELKIVDLRVTDPKFQLRYTLFRNDEFEIDIDYKEEFLGHPLRYNPGRRNIRKDLTTEEAEIIGFFALGFLDAQKPQEQAA